jgi:DNA-binding NtrC family response regulator
MNDWQVIPEIVGCDATLRMAAMQAVDAVEQGRHFVIEGETGSGRRLLARSAWCRRSPGARSLFTVDCRMFRSDGADALLFGERSSSGGHDTIQLGKLNLAMGGGLLLLHAECIPLKTQGRLAHWLEQFLCRPRNEGIQLLMTCTPSLHAALSLHPDLAEPLLRVRLPALRERLEDLSVIAEAFLRQASPFERIRCSQALIERFCGYDWPGNITELRSVLRRLLLEPHSGLLDVRHLNDLMCRDESSFALLQGPGPSQIETSFIQPGSLPDTWSMQ